MEFTEFMDFCLVFLAFNAIFTFCILIVFIIFGKELEDFYSGLRYFEDQKFSDITKSLQNIESLLNEINETIPIADHEDDPILCSLVDDDLEDIAKFLKMALKSEM